MERGLSVPRLIPGVQLSDQPRSHDALFAAVHEQDFKNVQRLLRGGADITISRRVSGLTILHFASLGHVITDDDEPDEFVGCGDNIFEAILARAQADAAKGQLDLEQYLQCTCVACSAGTGVAVLSSCRVRICLQLGYLRDTGSAVGIKPAVTLTQTFHAQVRTAVRLPLLPQRLGAAYTQQARRSV